MKNANFTIYVFVFLFSHLTLLANTKTPPPELKVYSFTSLLTKMLPGNSTENSKEYNCSGEIYDVDKIGNIALVSILYQNGCYTDGKYNHRDFLVEQGKVSDDQNQFSFDAYKIYEPKSKASNFLGSQHCIAYKFAKKEDYNVYQLDGKRIKKVKLIKQSEIHLGEYLLIKDLTVSKTSNFVIYFFVPASTSLSIYKQFSADVEGAKIRTTEVGELYKYRYATNHTPFDPDVGSSNTRQFFLLKDKQQPAVVWQDKETDDILLTNFYKNLEDQTTIKLPTERDGKLIAATNDDYGNIYYLVIQKQSNSDKAILFKVSQKGALIKKSLPDVSKSGMNIYRFGNYMADLEYNNNKLGLLIARTMFKSGDGLNHQGGIGVVFDANSLEVLRNTGQTSGHSFDNYLTTNTEGDFLAIDLGDNYPRGIHLHKFTDKGRRSKVVYTFKTLHGKHEQSPAGRKYPFYSEISTGSKKFYKWSNDNGTYSSLGAVIELDDGYVVVFTGEPDGNGKSINNARAGTNDDARNIGFLKIVKDFETKGGSGCKVSDEIILSKGITESGGVYTFGGRWTEQRNTGVQWLTNYKSKSTASVKNLKAIKIKNNEILVLWETHIMKGYHSKYLSTYAMKLNKDGKLISKIVDLGSHVRLNRRDELMNINNKIFAVSGSKNEKKLELLVFNLE